jgi:flagellar biosynthesis protein FliR
MATLEEFLATGIFAFLIAFTRIGTAMMIMPGVGDSFVSTNVRLYIAMGLALVLTPVLQPFMPDPLPVLPVMFTLIGMEFIIGLFVGTIARVLMSALDTAGMIISLMSGFANAQVFNPSMASQGSIVGAFMSITGVTLLFALNLHHLLIYGLVESYHLFPLGGVPDTGSMAELMARAVSSAFYIGFQIAIPFVVVGLLVYIGMGVLARVMPQIQVFLIALPLQIMLSLMTLMLVVSAAFMFWAAQFESGMMYFLSNGER